MREESFLVKLWNVLWPPAIVVVAQMLVTFLGLLVVKLIVSIMGIDGTGILGASELMFMMLISTVVCIPLCLKIYRRDQICAGEKKRNLPMTNKDIVVIVIAGASISLAGNNLISLTQLPQIFTGYEEVNETLYGGGLLLQVLVAGIFGPIGEELSMRGISYMRMKRYWGRRCAIFFSAAVFGIYHMNVVQGIYAFVLGIFFAWVYDRYETLWAPIIAHMSANIFVILLSENTIVNNVLSTMVGFCLATCISVLLFYYCMRFMKQTDPRVELRFEEKEPDTLEKLMEEYNGQDRKEE